jgi:hypothetical protein
MEQRLRTSHLRVRDLAGNDPKFLWSAPWDGLVQTPITRSQRLRVRFSRPLRRRRWNADLWQSRREGTASLSGHPSERTRNGESKRCRLVPEFLPIGGRCGSPAGAQDSAAQGLKAWRCNGRGLRLRQARHSGVRPAETQSVRKIVHISADVAWSQRRKSPAPLNQLQNGSVIEHQPADS